MTRANDARRYVEWLQKLHPDTLVEPGPDFAEQLVGVSPVTGGALHVKASETQPNQGVVVYRSDPDKAKVGIENNQKLDPGVAEADPVADLIIIGGGALLFIGAVACVASVGCVTAVAVSATTAAAAAAREQLTKAA